MADDYNSRYRSSGPYGHPPAHGGQGSDPLAELARLIGQNDPFSDAGRGATVAPQHPQQAYYAEQQPAYGHEQAAAAGWHSTAPPQPDYDPFAPAAQPPPMSAEPRYDSHPYADPQTQHGFGAYPQEQAPPYSASGYAAAPPFDQAMPAAHGAVDPAGYQPAGYHQAGGQMPPPHEDDFYDDAPRGRRKGLITVLAVLCLAVLGTAGAFAYRTMFAGGTSASSAPPVIRASNEPSKVAPPPISNDAIANKLSYDRFGDRGQNEQVVVREEQPLDINTLARGSAPPRSGTPATSPVTAFANAPPTTQQNNPPNVLSQPKAVRTERIRADQPDPARAQSMAAPPLQRSTLASAAPPNSAVEMQPPPSASTNLPPPPSRSSAAPRMSAPPPSANAPLSLSPDSSGTLPPPNSRDASQQRPPARARVASGPAGNGSYLVQVSSQRSEADAQTAFRSLQSRYSNVLGERQAVIRRADLGEKGVYYRAMVGPFASRDQAVQLCGSLKAAGGDCVVQGN